MGKGLFRTQVIVTGELETDEHSVLRVLSNRARREDIRAFLKRAEAMIAQGDRERTDAVIQVSIRANYELYQDIYREEPNMCEALRELMKDDIEREAKAGMQQGIQQGIQQNQISSIRSLMANLGLSMQQAMDALSVPAEQQKEFAAKLKM